jgi:ribosomal protein S13
VATGDAYPSARHAQTLLAELRDAEGRGLPRHVERELAEYLRCGMEIEVYKGTRHGWTTPDSKVYNPEQVEKAWARMMAQFKETLTQCVQKADQAERCQHWRCHANYCHTFDVNREEQMTIIKTSCVPFSRARRHKRR